MAKFGRKVIKDGNRSGRAFENTKAFVICPHQQQKGTDNRESELNEILSKMEIVGIGKKGPSFPINI